MNSQLIELRKTLDQKKGVKSHIEKELEDLRRNSKRETLRAQNLEKSLEISKKVGLSTQQELEFHISNIVTAALSAVFPNDPYTFKILFGERRGKTECDLFLERNGELLEPLSASGGGVVDIVSLALRIASLSLKSGNIQPVLFLDEPFKHLSIDLQERAEEMIHELSHRIGIQVIYNSHTISAGMFADQVFSVKLKNGKSIVTCVKNN